MKFRSLPLVLLLPCVFACTAESPELPSVSQNDPIPVLEVYDAGFSRTTTNAKTFAVEWTDGDAISVFNAPVGASGWSGNLKFTTSDAGAGIFSPAPGVTVPFTEGVMYNWKAVYPYTAGLSHNQLPSIPTTQTQNGKNNTDHLATYDVLYGLASSTRSPQIAMQHAGTLLKWTVKNDSELPFVVNSIRFNNGSKTYTLNVSGQVELSPSYSGNFFMVTDPFDFSAGDKIEVIVSTSAGLETQIKHIPSAKSFQAGCYNTATIVCNPAESPAEFHVAKNADGKWRVYKGTEEFFMKGVAANNYYDKVAAFGGNVIRTYNLAQLDAALAAAQLAGIYVLVGIPVGRERDGFDFDNAAAIAQQQAQIENIVSTYKSHPAVLGWILGNELDSNYSDARVWTVVENLALAIKASDPYHLITTALAGAKQAAISQIKNQAPSLDFLSVNSYYPSVSSLQASLSSCGWTKPWAVTEFGPRGTWNLSPTSDPPTTSWDACVEQTSTQKARIYKDILQNSIAANQDKGCIGSFAFVWGYLTSGAVLTWYGLFDTQGYSYGAVDELQYAWTGAYPANLAPVINNRHAMVVDLTLIGDDNVTFEAGSSHSAFVSATSPCNAALTYTWAIYEEGDSGSNGSGSGIPGLIQDPTKANIAFTAPSTVGNYRLVVFVRDDANKKVAMASCPFQITSGNMGMSADQWNSGHIGW